MLTNEFSFKANWSWKNRLPIILQSEATECGLVSIAMVLFYYGYKTDMASLRRENDVSLQGTTFADLSVIAEKYGLAARGVSVDLEHMDELELPCVLHWDMNHFVVLKSIDKKKAVIHDPANGIQKISIEDLGKHFTGVALELFPTAKFQKKKLNLRLSLWSFFSNFPGLKGIFAQMFALATILQICTVVTPFFMQWTIDEVLVSNDADLLLAIVLGYFLLVSFQMVISALRMYMSIYLSSKLSLKIGINVFDHLMRLPLHYFEARHIGDVVSRFESVEHINNFITNTFVQMVLNLFLMVATFIMIFVYSGLLAAIVFVSTVLLAMIQVMMYRSYRRINSDQVVAKANSHSNFMESIRSMQAIKLYSKELDRKSRWLNNFTRVVNLDVSIGKFQMIFKSAILFIQGLESVIVLYFGALLIMEGNMSIGIFIAFLAYKREFSKRFVDFFSEILDFRMLSIHLERLSDIVLTEKDTNTAGKKVINLNIAGSIELRNLSYRHHKLEDKLLNNVNLKVNVGEKVAITGSSGTGKTTLMKIMTGLLYPEDGKILLDGVDHLEMGTTFYRKHISAVMQDDQLFSGSIRENIAFFDPEPDQARVEECAKIACIAEDIDAMPMQYNSLIGDMGTVLSGGQKQRVLLARALYSRPRVLFLDESTSHLDDKTEKEVNKNISELGITTILIAHRKETIQMADRIVELKNGALAEVSDELNIKFA